MCAGREKIADASGKSAVVEYIGNEMSVVEPDAEGYQAATNFLLTPGDYDFWQGTGPLSDHHGSAHRKQGRAQEREP